MSTNGQNLSDEQLEALKDRFSGYQLPMIQLDSTGPQYVLLGPHPYFSNQPSSWTKPAYHTGPIAASSHSETVQSKNTFTDENIQSDIQLWQYLAF